MGRYYTGKFLHGFGVLLTLTVILFPMYWMVAASFKTDDQLFTVPPVWFWQPTLSGYTDAIASSTMICAPVIIGGIIVHKYIARGLTLGAVK